MQIKSTLEARHSREDAIAIKDAIIKNPALVDDLMECYFSKSIRLCQRASWSIMFLGLEAPDILRPYLSKMVDHLPTAQHDAQIRNTVRIFEEIEIPEDLEGPLFEHCFGYLLDSKYATAIRAFSLTVLEKIANKHPDLKSELRDEISVQLDTGTVGFKNRAKKTLLRLQKS
jgi:hypothetical protein